MFLAKKLLTALLLPPLGLLLLALVGLWLARRHPRSGRGLAAFAVVTLLALSMPPVADALIHSLEDHAPIGTQGLARAQAIVVLAGGVYHAAPEYGADTVGRWTLERTRYGAWLQRRSGLPILVTGGAPFGGRPEGEAMKEVIERDFRGQVRWVENASRDTFENAIFSAGMLKAAGIERIALVSHAWHLPRAVALFEAQGLEVFPAPMGFATQPPSAFAQALPSMDALADSRLALREWLGRLANRLGAARLVRHKTPHKTPQSTATISRLVPSALRAT